jgi:hypothetical protein
MTNPDVPQEAEATALAEAGASNDAITQAVEGFATVADSNQLVADALLPPRPMGQTYPYCDDTPPSCDPPLPLPTLPVLPTGFDWVVELKEHRDSTNLTDHSNYDDYDWQGWFWEDGRPICGHRRAVVFLRQNGVILHQRSAQVEGLDDEFSFVSKVVETACEILNQHDLDRMGWAATNFPNPSGVS